MARRDRNTGSLDADYDMLLFGKHKRLALAVDGRLDSFQVPFGLFLGRLLQMCDTTDFESRHSVAPCNR